MSEHVYSLLGLVWEAICKFWLSEEDQLDVLYKMLVEVINDWFWDWYDPQA